jgi:hypothetical protein
LVRAVAAVSDGERRFVGFERAAETHRHVNRIRIGAESLREGWIELTQCHEHLDTVHAVQILFGADRLALMPHQPAAQPGFEVRAESGHVAVDAAFEGRFFTCLDFCGTGSSDCEPAASDCSQ